MYPNLQQGSEQPIMPSCSQVWEGRSRLLSTLGLYVSRSYTCLDTNWTRTKLVDQGPLSAPPHAGCAPPALHSLKLGGWLSHWAGSVDSSHTDGSSCHACALFPHLCLLACAAPICLLSLWSSGTFLASCQIFMDRILVSTVLIWILSLPPP